MKRITSLFVWKVLGQAGEGLDRTYLLRSLGIDPEGPVDPSVMVADKDYYEFFETVVRSAPEGHGVPLRVGASMRCDDYGAFGLAWKSAPDLRGSYERLQRFARILTDVSEYEVSDVDDGVLMQLHREGPRTLGLRLSNEATIASIVSMSRQVSTREFRPGEIHFKHAAPDGHGEHERHFGCPVFFGSGMDALLVPNDAMSAPNRLGDPAIAEFFDTHLDSELAGMGECDDLEHRVRSCVSSHLSEGVPTVSTIARSLGMSGRTLQRRLSEKGSTFQVLVDESRRQLAQKLLKETDYPLMEIAFLTGFSEQSAFTRAFRRWAGQTPRSYRLEG